MKISIKNTYLLMVAVITLLGIVIVPTYAKFVYTDVIKKGDEEIKVTQINLDFDIEISNIDQYEEITVKSGHSVEFNVDIFNNTDSNLYYGIWYKMVYPNTLPDNDLIQIGKITNTTTSTTGEVQTKNNVTASIGIINNSSDDIKIYIGVNSSTTSTSDIEYLDGKTLITGTVKELSDIHISSVTIDGGLSSGLPSSGYYNMTSYECVKGSELSWNSLTKELSYNVGSYAKDSCDLVFTSSTEYPLLSEMEVGSYVAYTGSNGCSGNSCEGQNANYVDDDDMGFCHDGFRYIANGWRIAYIENESVHLISAGATDCLCTNSDGTTSASSCSSSLALSNLSTQTNKMNEISRKYCNPFYAKDGVCNNNTAWAMKNSDFEKITGTPISSTTCYNQISSKDCGYNNDLIDNGSNYWLATEFGDSVAGWYTWYAYERTVSRYNSSRSYGIRPVLALDSSVVVIGGTGTYQDPYLIQSFQNLTNVSLYSGPTKSTYNPDEELDLSGLKLQLTYEGGSTQVINGEDYVTNTTTNDDITSGIRHTITINYPGFDSFTATTYKNGWWGDLQKTYYYYINNGEKATGDQYLANTNNSFEKSYFYFDNNGLMKTGWRNLGNYNWYYYAEPRSPLVDGSASTKTWDSYFRTSNVVIGSKIINTWAKIYQASNSKWYWYYFDENGIMVQGWRIVGNDWYYFREVGVTTSGWDGPVGSMLACSTGNETDDTSSTCSSATYTISGSTTSTWNGTYSFNSSGYCISCKS